MATGARDERQQNFSSSSLLLPANASANIRRNSHSKVAANVWPSHRRQQSCGFPTSHHVARLARPRRSRPSSGARARGCRDVLTSARASPTSTPLKHVKQAANEALRAVHTKHSDRRERELQGRSSVFERGLRALRAVASDATPGQTRSQFLVSLTGPGMNVLIRSPTGSRPRHRHLRGATPVFIETEETEFLLRSSRSRAPSPATKPYHPQLAVEPFRTRLPAGRVREDSGNGRRARHLRHH